MLIRFHNPKVLMPFYEEYPAYVLVVIEMSTFGIGEDTLWPPRSLGRVNANRIQKWTVGCKTFAHFNLGEFGASSVVWILQARALTYCSRIFVGRTEINNKSSNNTNQWPPLLPPKKRSPFDNSF
jgi:hypothetical protein